MDEIEKGLSGTASSGVVDGGVAARVVDARLRERNHGKWQGYTVAGLDEDYPDWRTSWRGGGIDGKAPGGESVREMI